MDERNDGVNRPESGYDEGADFWGDAARQRRRGRRMSVQPDGFATPDAANAGDGTGDGAGYGTGAGVGTAAGSSAGIAAESDTFDYAPLPLGKRRRPIIRNFWLYTLSFAVPFLLVSIAFVAMQFYPVADRTPLTVDLYHQYAPFMSELRYKVLNGESLLYSWHGGLGMNFLAIFTYYLASPLNVLLLIVPLSGLAVAIILLIALKIGLMGLFMGILLHRGVMAFTEPGIGAIGAGGPGKFAPPAVPRRRLLRLRSVERTDEFDMRERNRRLYEREVDTRRGHTYLVIVGATLFALSGFMMAYFWDVMWLDSIYLLPLVALGVILLVRKGNLVLYPISIALAVAVNYYIGFFVALFTALFFIFYLISAWPDLGTERSRPGRIALLRIFQFVLMSGLAAGMTAFLSLPTWLALQMTSAAGDSFPKNHKFDFTVLEFMTRHLISMKPSIRDGLPNIYAGLISLFALPLYIFNERIRLREKVTSLSLLGLLFLSFNSNYLNFIWHGMHYPNQLPYRYSFLYSFLLVIIAVRALMNLRYLKKGVAMGAGALLIVLIVLTEVLFKDKVPPETVYVSVVFVAIYMLAMRPRTRRRLPYSLAILFLCIMVLCESLTSSILLLNQVGQNEGFTSHKGYTGDLVSVTNVIEAVKKNDPDFWRMEVLPPKSTDDPALYNYNGLTIFSSTVNKPTAQSMRKLGFHGNNINSYKYVNSTALTDMLFGIRYRISKNQSWDDPRWTNMPMTDLGVSVEGDKNPYLYKNDEALAPLWFIHEEPSRLVLSSGNAFENLHKLLTAADPSLKDVVKFQKIEVLSGLNVTPRGGTEQSGYRFDLENSKKDTQVTVYIDVKEDSWQYFHIDTSRRTEIKVWRESDNEFYVVPTTTADDSADESSEKEDVGGKQTISADYSMPDKNAESETVPSRTTGGNIQSRNMRVPEMIDAGFVKAGDRVTLHVKQNADDATAFTLYSASLTAAGLTRAYETIAPQMLRNIRWDSRSLNGELTAPKDGYAFATIPWDGGWKVSVNGMQVTPVAVQKAWLAIPVKEGLNRIEMRYAPPGFETGLIATALSLLAFIFVSLLTAAIRLKREERRRKKREAAMRMTLSDIHLPDREE